MVKNVGFAVAKLAGTLKSITTMLEESKRAQGLPRTNWPPADAAHHFEGAERQRQILATELPELFGDLPSFNPEPSAKMNDQPPNYARGQLERLQRDIGEVFERRANSELAQPSQKPEIQRRVFISHGRAPDWREVQVFVEKDIGLPTIELAQEASQGMTIIEKLFDKAEVCDSAIIVMTGDDESLDGQARARENVMHEIGFFQGKYGRRNVLLLHEDGVSIPTNLSGIVYVPFPKRAVAAGFHVIQRELKAMYTGI